MKSMMNNLVFVRTGWYRDKKPAHFMSNSSVVIVVKERHFRAGCNLFNFQSRGGVKLLFVYARLQHI
jgi:hypothetical protein